MKVPDRAKPGQAMLVPVPKVEGPPGDWCLRSMQRVHSVGALIIKLGFWRFLIISIIYCNMPPDPILVIEALLKEPLRI